MTANLIAAPQLRDYQLDIIQQIFDYWFNGHNSVAMQLPTGAGKTIIFTAVANETTRSSHQKPNRVVSSHW